MKCRICGNSEGNKRHVAREMMFGMGDVFPYTECVRCGSLQIEEIPPDVARYYPPEYYSFQEAAPAQRSPLRQLAADGRDRYALLGRGVTGALWHWLLPAGPLEALRPARIRRTTRILDVGCGSGALVQRIRSLGVQAVGIDPYAPREVRDDNGAPLVLRQELREHVGTYDLILFLDSFEHMPDPAGVLQHAAGLLSDDGECFLRMPIVPNAAWERYGVHWVQLDAPRHFHIHSRESLRLLAEAAGLRVARVLINSTGFQFWGSEHYARGLPLVTRESPVASPARLFTRAEIAGFERQARRLNREGRGDSAIFFLRRV